MDLECGKLAHPALATRPRCKADSIMLPYFKNKTWAATSREERLFCAELFFVIRGREGEFVAWLNEREATGSRKLDPSQAWEVAFEACFYRDVLVAVGKPVRTSEFSDKRTFDLCLFSPTDIVVIEAKAQGGFESEQNGEFAKDRVNIPRVLAEAGYVDSPPHVSIVALASSVYFRNVVKYGATRSIPEVFDGHFSWREVHESFESHPAFERADVIYKK